MALVSSLVRAWESVQVELQGQYSIARLRQVARHLQTTRLRIDVLTLAFVPIFQIVILVLNDLPPLEPIEAGLKHQGFAYEWRVFSLVFVTTVAFLYMYTDLSPSHSVSTLQLWTISLVLACAIAGISYPLASAIGFPLPFRMITTSPLWFVMLGVCLRMTWPRQPQAQDHAARGLRWYMLNNSIGGVLATVYPLLRYAYTIADARSQLLIAVSFPILRLLFRNLASSAAFEMEDVAPLVVVCGVDVFHALFLSCILQGGNSNRATAVTMAFDFAQSCVSIYDVHHVLRSVRKIKLHGTNKIAPSLSTTKEHATMIEATVAILDANPELSTRCPSIAQPRHLRAKSSRQVHAVLGVKGPSVSQTQTDRLLPQHREQAAFVGHVLKLLHVVEFYMLIEFVEVILALIYATFLTAMSHLPNRRFYLQIKDMTDEQLSVAIQNILTYASLELLSFIALGIVLSRMLGVSAFRVLTFALQKNWRIVYGQVTGVVFLIIEFSLEHSGCDFTFQFKWLRQQT